MKRADREARSRAPDRRVVETPEGTLTIELDWMMGGVVADMTLYGANGWKADTWFWAEQFRRDPERDDDRTLPQVISEWTGMPLVDAEAFVEETISRWRRSSAFERDVKLGRRSMQLMAAVAIVAVLALVGIASLVWLVISALT